MTGAPSTAPAGPQANAGIAPVMEHVIDLYESLETRYERLRQAYASLIKKHLELNAQLRALQSKDASAPAGPGTRGAIDNAPLAQGGFITSAAGDILTVNAAFCSMTGYSAAEAIGKNPRFLQSGLQDADFYKDFWRELTDAGAWQGQIFNRRKSGAIYSQWLQINQNKDPLGRVLSYSAVMYDLSDLASQEMQELRKTLPHNVYRTQAAASVPEGDATAD